MCSSDLGNGSPDAAGPESEGLSFRKARNLEQVGDSGDGGTSEGTENTLKAGRRGQRIALGRCGEFVGNVMSG